MQHIAQEVRQFVADNLVFGTLNTDFSDNDSFLENGLIDSMGVLTLVEFVRSRYGICIQDEELVPDNWDSVLRIARFIEARLPAVEQSQDAFRQSSRRAG